MRKIPFKNGEYYHIYNRGVDKRNIFDNKDHYSRFLKSLREFNQTEPIGSLFFKNLAVQQLKTIGKPIEKIVSLISFCLLPNHFHFILRQEKDGGISEFMKRIGGGYTQYYNYNEKRCGALFQGRFKSIHIDSNEYLLYLSAYINGNGNVHKISKDKVLSTLDFSKSDFIDMGPILSGFKDLLDYQKYARLISSEIGSKRDEVKRLILEEEF